MGRASSAIGALILAIAVYFALFWGYDALRILTSPTYGLEDVWRSQVVFGIGRFGGLDPNGLLRLAAALGALKLTVAGVCAIHVLDRIRALAGGEPSNEILETGLLIAVAVSVVSVAPAIWSHNGDLVRELLIQLLLAAFAAVLCIMERGGRKTKEDRTEAALEAAIAAHVANAGATQAAPAQVKTQWFSPWRR